MTATLTAEIERLAESLSANDADASLVGVAERIAKLFAVERDEVAVLVLADRDRALRFLVPEKLREAGSIPLSTVNSVAARTAREGRAQVLNHLADSPHVSVFQAIVPGGEKGQVIQKIMSVPIQVDGKVVGVLQISRKGRSRSAAGPDFTQKNLQELAAVTGALGKLVKLLPGS
jgi:transcriptional regulator with GAF, ATPase, and Fis domain